MYDKLKEEVCKANIKLFELGLVPFTWGNVSQIEGGVFGIKPSGVPYDELTPEKIVIVDLDGNVVEGVHRPSSDTATHAEIYRNFKDVKGDVHTHSLYATSFAQARKPIKCLGTTHADYFKGSIPLTRWLTKEETEKEYEKNTGKVIVEGIIRRNALEVPGILVSGHGPFAWGKSAEAAVKNAAVMEHVAKMNVEAHRLNPEVDEIDEYLVKKHFERKNGPDKYYGQDD